MKTVYCFLAIVGTILPYSAFLFWIVNNGLDVTALFHAANANAISLFAWLDVIIAAIALIAFILTDARKHSIKHSHYAIAGTLLVGVSCGLPLYLYLKERQCTYCD